MTFKHISLPWLKFPTWLSTAYRVKHKLLTTASKLLCGLTPSVLSLNTSYSSPRSQVPVTLAFPLSDATTSLGFHVCLFSLACSVPDGAWSLFAQTSEKPSQLKRSNFMTSLTLWLVLSPCVIVLTIVLSDTCILCLSLLRCELRGRDCFVCFSIPNT